MSSISRTFDPKDVRSRDLPLIHSCTALLSIDMQNSYCSAALREQGKAGSPLPPRTQYFYRVLDERAIPHQARLHLAARRTGLETIYMVIESLTSDGRDRGIDHKVSNIHIPPGSDHGKVISDVAPSADDIVLKKTASGAFGATNLDYILRNLGIDHLIVCGVVTHQCVENTVRQAADIGYLVTVAGEACATDSEEVHNAALRAMSGYARVCSTEEILTELARHQ